MSTLYGLVCAGAGTRLLQHQQWLAWPLWNHDLAASEARAQPWPGTSQSRSPAPQPPSPGTRTPEHCQHQLGTILRNLTKPSINWKFTANCHISMFLIVAGDTVLIQSLSEYKSLNLFIFSRFRHVVLLIWVGMRDTFFLDTGGLPCQGWNQTWSNGPISSRLTSIAHWVFAK